MDPLSESRARSGFGPFEFDHSAGELRKHRVKLRLAGQPLRILQVLLARPGEIVEREELQRQLWSGTTFVDFEHGLNAAINKLRQTLGDSAEAPRFVETVPGRGYRFIGELRSAAGPEIEPRTVHEDANRIDARPEVPATVPARRGFPDLLTKRSLAVGFGTVLLIATVAVLADFARREKALAEPAGSGGKAFRFLVPLPDSLKLSPAQTFAVSPDGHRLVFFARDGNGEQRLWMQTFDSSQPVALPGTESASDNVAFWSPDSNSIAFYADHNLKRLDLGGDHPRVIAKVSSNVLGGSWNRNGEIVFGSETDGISLVSSEGGPVRQVTARDPERAERVHAWPVFLPDGRKFLYSRLSSVPANTGVFAGSVEAKPGEQSLRPLVATPIGAQFVASEGEDKGTLLFQRENTLFAQVLDTSRLELIGEASAVARPVGYTRAYGFFSSSPRVLIHRMGRQDTGQFAWFNREGKKLETLGQPHLSHWSQPSISPDGRSVALSKFENGRIDVWAQDVARDVSQRITFDPAINVGPVWSADGKKIAFSSARAGQYDLYEVTSSGNGERLLLSSKESKMASSWSADGQFLLYTAQTGNSRVWALPMSGNNALKPVALTLGKSNHSDAVLSPDSRWIAYVSDESGTREVYVQTIALPTASGGLELGAKVLVSRGGGSRPRWRNDGRELFYRATEGSVMSVGIAPGPAFHPSIPRKLFDLAGAHWDASADGKRFLVEVPGDRASPAFTVILNWLEEFRK
jgi:Tol biopolymer transport system component/DNA-binding winged helix-turn-helix (wHTH) protein